MTTTTIERTTETTTPAEILERIPVQEEADAVATAALMLDELRPGWAALVDPDELVMGSCDRCILGQVYGAFDVGWRKFLNRFLLLGVDRLNGTGVFAYQASVPRWTEEVRSRT